MPAPAVVDVMGQGPQYITGSRRHGRENTGLTQQKGRNLKYFLSSIWCGIEGISGIHGRGGHGNQAALRNALPIGGCDRE